MAIKLKQSVSARVNVGQQTVPYLSKFYKYNMIDTTTPSTGTPGAIFGVLPAYSVPLECYVRVNVAFSSGDLKIGTTADMSTVCSTQDLASGTTGLYIIDRFKGTFSTSDVTFYCSNGTTGTGAGEADIWMTYLPNLQPTTY